MKMLRPDIRPREDPPLDPVEPVDMVRLIFLVAVGIGDEDV